MGLQDNQPEADKRITIHPHIQDGGYYPHRNQDPHHSNKFPKEANIEAVIKDLDTTDELREAAAVRIASYQQRLASLHNRWVKLHTFKAGE